jgi:hypothetical protein
MWLWGTSYCQIIEWSQLNSSPRRRKGLKSVQPRTIYRRFRSANPAAETKRLWINCLSTCLSIYSTTHQLLVHLFHNARETSRFSIGYLSNRTEINKEQLSHPSSTAKPGTLFFKTLKKSWVNPFPQKVGFVRAFVREPQTRRDHDLNANFVVKPQFLLNFLFTEH